MARRVEFTVDGILPPKKDGANAMWRKPSERQRLIALRRSAAAFEQQSPMTTEIRLEIEIHCPRLDLSQIGDLDNFIAGIRDGLMAAHQRTPIDGWQASELDDVHPAKVIAIQDDKAITEIVARKLVEDTAHYWYRVVLTEYASDLSHDYLLPDPPRPAQ